MIQKITPFLWLNGNVEAAVNFYTSVFKDSKIIYTRRSPAEKPGELGKLFTAAFLLQGQEFMVLDGGPMYSFTPAISFFVACETQEEIDELWEKLSAGGQTQRCGWLTDQFGVTWQIIPDQLGELLNHPDPAKASRVMNAMLKMTKLDIEGLKNA